MAEYCYSSECVGVSYSVVVCGDCGVECGVWRSVANVANLAECDDCGRVWRNVENVVECAIEWRIWRNVAGCGGMGRSVVDCGGECRNVANLAQCGGLCRSWWSVAKSCEYG